MSNPLSAVIGTASIALMAQIAPAPPVSPDSLSALLSLAGKLTADVVLVGAIWWLVGDLKAARADAKAELAAQRAEAKAAIAAKDEQIVKMDTEKTALAARVIETMVSVLEAVKELRVANSNVSEQMEALSKGFVVVAGKIDQIQPLSAKEVVEQLRRQPAGGAQ